MRNHVVEHVAMFDDVPGNQRTAGSAGEFMLDVAHPLPFSLEAGLVRHFDVHRTE
jgi:hypothetical protein